MSNLHGVSSQIYIITSSPDIFYSSLNAYDNHTIKGDQGRKDSHNYISLCYMFEIFAILLP